MALSTAAAQQYATRPHDERFPSLDALVADALADKTRAYETTRQMGSLRVEVGTKDGTVDVVGANPDGHPGRPATMTNWSFGQTARLIGGSLVSPDGEPTLTRTQPAGGARAPID